MSFSKDIKEELSKIGYLKDKSLVSAELIGYLITNNVRAKKNSLKYSTESEFNINRFAKLLNNIGVEDYEIDIQGKVFSININRDIKIDGILVNDRIEITANLNDIYNTEQMQKALVRGSFMGSGSLNNPEKIYHLEIIYSNEKNAEFVSNILKKYDIQIKRLNSSIYLKDGEEISKFLAFIGASNSVLKFEEIRVIRDMRNNVNRIVNCETANLNKTINAALKQIDDIKFIKEMNRFGELPENLQEVANLRLENPDIPFAELGKLLSKPVGKSGVNYRLKSICKYAEELRK